MIRTILQAETPSLLLASASATRQALLAGCGLAFEVVCPDVDEDAIKAECRMVGRTAGETALALARAKAEGPASARPEALVIAADQLLACEGEWFVKPRDLHEARRQLGRLAGRRQVLHTAAVMMRDGVLRWSHLAEPSVAVRSVSEEVLDAYVAAEGSALLACAGACRVEGLGQLILDSVEGEHAAILGLPLLPLLAALRAEGVLPR